MPYESESGTINLAFAGEAMITRALTPFREARFLALRELFHTADVRFCHGEMNFNNYEHPQGPAMAFRCDPRLIKDLQWLGINMMSMAHNHSHDFGESGVVTNIRNLDEAGMVHAGTGRNYSEALAPAYLDTVHGRVALVSATSTGAAHTRAGEQRRDMQGRPGSNFIRWINEWTVDQEAFEALTRVAQKLGWAQHVPAWWARDYGVGGVPTVGQVAEYDPPEDSGPAVYFADKSTFGEPTSIVNDPTSRFVLDTEFRRRTRVHKSDAQRNIQSVREARRMADWVIFTVHNHECEDGDEDVPSSHIRDLAHAVIDVGADVVVGHGPHKDRGIELYHGKPIMYSIGNFIAQQPTPVLESQDVHRRYGLSQESSVSDVIDLHYNRKRARPASPAYWWSAVIVLKFAGKQLTEMKIHPIEFGEGLPRSQAGRPMLAEGEMAQRSLQRFRRLSESFGTQVDVLGSVGVVRVTPA
jgi:poly-gamma-glutamate synthesis protein (capsule biosynthesis protein)